VAVAAFSAWTGVMPGQFLRWTCGQQDYDDIADDVCGIMELCAMAMNLFGDSGGSSSRQATSFPPLSIMKTSRIVNSFRRRRGKVFTKRKPFTIIRQSSVVDQ
jgi:hypothetical protein